MIIDNIHKQIPYLTDMRAREIRVDKSQRTVFCIFSYPDVTTLDVGTRGRIEKIVSSELPKGYFYSMHYVDDVFSPVSFVRNFIEFVRERFPVFIGIGKNNIYVEIDGRQINVRILVDDVTVANMQNSNFCEILEEHYKDYTCYSVIFTLESDVASQSASVEEQERLVQLAINKELMQPARFFHISAVNPKIGKSIDVDPMYIGDLRNPLDSCVLCGTIYAKRCRQAKNNPLLYVCRFILKDSLGGSIPCVVFIRMQITDVQLIMSETGRDEKDAATLAQKRLSANDKKLKAVTWLADGMTVAVRGKATLGQNGQLEMHVYDLCTCDIDSIASSAQFNRKVATNYLLAKPEDCTEVKQVNFIDAFSENTLTSRRNLAVLHVNATGLDNVVEDRLLAICAVKVECGHVTERLFSYVNPEKTVEEKPLKMCRLTQNKVIFYPTLTELISDYYKFLLGFELVGNDLSKIVELLNYYAAPMNYRFCNKTVAQSDLLASLWNSSTICTEDGPAPKIDEMAKKCKISSAGSSFCFDSALTVAKIIAFLSFRAK